MPVEKEEEIVVTATRIRYDPPSNLELLGHFSTYVPAQAPDIFAQYGGGETPQIAHFELIDGDLVVTLPGYDFKLKLPAADWERMGEQERGEFVKLMNEFTESPMFEDTLNLINSYELTEIIIRYDSLIHKADGSTQQWSSNETQVQFGHASLGHPTIPGTQTPDTSRLLALVININPAEIPGDHTRTTEDGQTLTIGFGLTFLHEMRHVFYPGDGGETEESQVRNDSDTMYQDIFSTGGAERSIQDYLGGLTFVGSMYDDNAGGSGASDTLSGLSGNDTLDGAAGDDLVMGGAGMDRLSGGTGTNYVLGGLDADTYAPAAGVTLEQIGEMGGVDRLDLSRFMLSDAVFSRDGDMLIIRFFGATVEEVVIEEQWLAEGKIEQFVFADGTYAASYIEYLAETSGGTGMCYDELGQPVICGPYGMPVVLDLDGDGIELIDVSRSRVRFDINGDGVKERIGWVGRDDGILALDRDGSGRIDDFSEISFLQDFLGAGSDLEGLMAYDSNGDGFLTGADERFGDFLVWRDSNGNGKSEKHELFTLEELEIVSIDLERGDLRPLDIDANTNQVLATSAFRTMDGQTHRLGDVALFTDLADCGCDYLFRGEPGWLLSEAVVP